MTGSAILASLTGPAVIGAMIASLAIVIAAVLAWRDRYK